MGAGDGPSPPGELGGAPVWVDGRFVRGAAIAATDAGFSAGIGVFETMAAVSGEVPLWERHLERLRRGAEFLAIPWTPPSGLRAAAAELLARSGLAEAALRLTLSGGVPGERPTWCMTARGRTPRAEPVRLLPVASAPPDDGTAAHKTLSRARYARALALARAAGADDALLLDRDGRVLETTTANVWLVDGDRLVTPPLGPGVLPGIARALLLDELAVRGVPVTERAVRLADLGGRGLVVTNALHGPRAAALAGHGARPVPASLACIWRTLAGL